MKSKYDQELKTSGTADERKLKQKSKLVEIQICSISYTVSVFKLYGFSVEDLRRMVQDAQTCTDKIIHERDELKHELTQNKKIISKLDSDLKEKGCYFFNLFQHIEIYCHSDVFYSRTNYKFRE